MDLGALKSQALEKGRAVYQNKKAFYSLLALFFIVLIVWLVKVYRGIVAKEQAEPVFIRNVKDAKNTIQVPGNIIQSPENGTSFTYSVWLYINDFNVGKGRIKHVFHKGDENMNTMAPGVFLAPSINSLVVLVDTVRRQPSNILTDKYNAQAPNDNETKDVEYDVLQPCSCEDRLKMSSTAKTATYVSNTDGSGGKCYLYNEDKILTGKSNAITWKKPQGSNTDVYTMNPMKNTAILSNDDAAVVVENVPLQRWFHLAIVFSASTVEVYVDGKLYKTLVLQSDIKLNNENLHASMNEGFSGMMNELRYFPYALRYIDVYNMYSRGPTPFYFMNMLRGKRLELYEKHFEELKKSFGQTYEDISDFTLGLSESIFGAAQAPPS